MRLKVPSKLQILMESSLVSLENRQAHHPDFFKVELWTLKHTSKLECSRMAVEGWSPGGLAQMSSQFSCSITNLTAILKERPLSSKTTYPI